MDSNQIFSSHQVRHGAMMSLYKKLNAMCLPIEDQAGDQWLSIMAAVCLAQRSMIPQALVGSALERFIVDYAESLGLPAPVIDGTDFGHWGGQFATKPLSNDFESILHRHQIRILALLKEFKRSAHLGDVHTVGWFKQCLIQSAQKTLPDKIGHRERASLDDLAGLTQWFTPAWIAEFLIKESLAGRSEAIFLDPACGAGHLMATALKYLFETKMSAHNQEPLDCLSEILIHQIFGIDIDADLVEIAGFCLYLQAFDLIGMAELPTANIFCVGGTEEERGIGSLWLGAQKPPQTLRLLVDKKEVDLAALPQCFDAIAMNPPYLSHRLMPAGIAAFLKLHYPNSRYDLYAAFLEMGLRKLAPKGRLAAICQQSFLTVQRYYELRQAVIEQSRINCVVQLGSGCFATKGGEKVNNALVVIEKGSQQTDGDIRCWRVLTKEEKSIAELHGIEALSGQVIPRAHAEKLFTYIPKSPFVFWAPSEILQLFKERPPLENPDSGMVCVNGLFTCNNDKFVCRFDQIDESRAADYVPYDKGGGYKWYRTSPLMLLWKQDGQEIRDYRVQRGQSASLPGESYYFKTGVTYSYIGTRGFKARLLSPGSVFDIASSAVFSQHVDVLYLLGFLNSSLVRFILGILNPTINFQIGDIRRIPFSYPDTQLEKTVSNLVSKAVEIAKEIETFDPGSPTFAGVLKQRYGVDSELAEERHLVSCTNWIKEEQQIQQQIDDLMFDFYRIDKRSRALIAADPWVSRNQQSFADYCKRDFRHRSEV